MFLSSLQTSSSNFTTKDHGISMEKTALERELSYLPDFDASNLTIETFGDNIIVEGAVKSETEPVFFGLLMKSSATIASFPG